MPSPSSKIWPSPSMILICCVIGSSSANKGIHPAVSELSSSFARTRGCGLSRALKSCDSCYQNRRHLRTLQIASGHENCQLDDPPVTHAKQLVLSEYRCRPCGCEARCK